MTIVVDASVAAKWLFAETDTPKARLLLREIRKGNLQSLAPDILPAEIANSLSKRVFRGMLEALEAEAQFERFRRSCPALIGNGFLATAALQLALRYRHSIYDCLYVALAMATPCDLVTADERLYRAFSPSMPQVRLLRDWKA